MAGDGSGGSNNSENGRDSLLRYYWRELCYLRRMGAAFAEAHPKVAAAWSCGTANAPDPHVERLIESFAFLTARIQHDLDSEYPEIAAELLDLLYPHYLRPIPSMAVARFDVDPERGKLTGGHLIPRHTPLFAHARRREGSSRARSAASAPPIPSRSGRSR